eukprot:CAMPEP_0174942462 /NCGR_PEP_ID=MMETSP1355-20121228/74376_1 /TAXON_ID=464990 /ORGANISM="Hemiselmis tepida, Strain CCMP443" /LENGTH=58 /DNA_ID=CAMNT_0016189635 /DNA_START=99 /DNA_END=271 /DNA_ORIENTATION=-
MAAASGHGQVPGAGMGGERPSTRDSWGDFPGPRDGRGDAGPAAAGTPPRGTTAPPSSS